MQALQDTLDQDYLSLAPSMSEFRDEFTPNQALKAWEKFLQRDDLTTIMRAHALQRYVYELRKHKTNQDGPPVWNQKQVDAVFLELLELEDNRATRRTLKSWWTYTNTRGRASRDIKIAEWLLEAREKELKEPTIIFHNVINRDGREKPVIRREDPNGHTSLLNQIDQDLKQMVNHLGRKPDRFETLSDEDKAKREELKQKITKVLQEH